MSGHYIYNLASPPRRVPWPVRSQLLFGGFANQFGWLWLGFSMIFVWIFGLNTDVSLPLFLLAPLDTAQATVTAVAATNASENEVTIYAYDYVYRVEKLEIELEGTAYSTGKKYSPGQTVTVEYLAPAPHLSRLVDTRRAMFAPWTLFILIFPLIGLAFVGWGLKNGIKADRLLRHGRVALGTLTGKEATNVSVNEQTVYKLTFNFTADDGMPYKVSTQTHQPHTLEDDAEERLLYNPRRPQEAVTLDNLPGAPDIDELGYIQPGGKKGGLVLVLPALVVLVNLGVLVLNRL